MNYLLYSIEDSLCVSVIIACCLYSYSVSVAMMGEGVRVAWEPTITAPIVDSPCEESYLHDTPGEPSETPMYRCPMICWAEPHHCWYVDRGMEMAMQIRRWLACPVPLDGGRMEVLDEL